MTDMVEKVARALCVAKALDPDWDYDPSLLGGKINKRWMMFTSDARVAIEAMREPTQMMRKAGNLALSHNGVDNVEEDDSLAAFQAMIDTALGENTHEG